MTRKFIGLAIRKYNHLSSQEAYGSSLTEQQPILFDVFVQVDLDKSSRPRHQRPEMVTSSTMRPAAELAVRIGRELLKVSATSRSARTWSPSIEHTLHSLGFRHSINPSLVARVIDPFLLNHHSLALGFFNWAAQQPGYSHDSISYHSIFKTLSLSRQFSAMDALFKQVKTQKILLDSSVYRSLIDALLLGKKAQSAFWVLEEALSTGQEMNHDVCNRLLAALTSDGYSDYAQKLFVKMRQRGVSLNTLGFGIYIGSLCRNSDTNQLLRLVGEVKKSNLNINGSIIALLILNGLCKASREMDAFYILEELRNIDCKPDFMAYRIIAEAFVVTGNLYERQVVLKKKRKLGVAPRSSDYRDFILDLISAKRLIEAKEVAEVIVSGNFPIDNDILDALIGSVSTVDPDSAVGFLNFMVVNTGKFPAIRTLSKLSKNLCRHEKDDLLIKAYEVLSSRGYFSEPESYSLMISFLCKAGRVREGYSALHEMKKKGFDPDVSLYNSLIEACCRAEMIRPAKKLWDEMFVEGCRMNLTTYNVLIKKLSEEGEVDESLRLFQKMLEKGIEPDETIYTSLIEGLCKDTKLEDALEVFRKCMERDQIVGRRVLITFVFNLCSNGHFGEASQLLREREHLDHTGAHVVLLKCVADAKEVEIGIKHMKWIKEVSPPLVHTICSDLSASSCSSSDPDSILPFIRALEHT